MTARGIALAQHPPTPGQMGAASTETVCSRDGCGGHAGRDGLCPAHRPEPGSAWEIEILGALVDRPERTPEQIVDDLWPDVPAARAEWSVASGITRHELTPRLVQHTLWALARRGLAVDIGGDRWCAVQDGEIIDGPAAVRVWLDVLGEDATPGAIAEEMDLPATTVSRWMRRMR